MLQPEHLPPALPIASGQLVDAHIRRTGGCGETAGLRGDPRREFGSRYTPTSCPFGDAPGFTHWVIQVTRVPGRHSCPGPRSAGPLPTPFQRCTVFCEPALSRIREPL